MLKRLSFSEFKKIYSKVPRLTVDLAVKTPKGILLTKRAIAPAKGRWHIPGGTLLKGEKLTQAAQRVAKEEFGLRIKVLKFLGYIEYDFPGYFGQPVTLVFLAKPLGGKIRLDKNAQAFGFFKNIPKNTIREQAAFLRKKLAMK